MLSSLELHNPSIASCLEVQELRVDEMSRLDYTWVEVSSAWASAQQAAIR
jgi:hypothetical protein